MILMFVQLFKDATAFFSCATPYLAKVIPAMNHIDQHLTTAVCNNAYKPCIQAAIAMGKKLFFFHAADGIRSLYVTGVQTCALPIPTPRRSTVRSRRPARPATGSCSSRPG